MPTAFGLFCAIPRATTALGRQFNFFSIYPFARGKTRVFGKRGRTSLNARSCSTAAVVSHDLNHIEQPTASGLLYYGKRTRAGPPGKEGCCSPIPKLLPRHLVLDVRVSRVEDVTPIQISATFGDARCLLPTRSRM